MLRSAGIATVPSANLASRRYGRRRCSGQPLAPTSVLDHPDDGNVPTHRRDDYSTT